MVARNSGSEKKSTFPFLESGKPVFQTIDRAIERLHQRLPLHVHIIILRLRRIRTYVPGADFDCGSNLITFDAFDTLITRPVFKPTDIFLLAGYVLQREGLSTLTPSAWHDLRSAAESEMRSQAGEREITLSEIYQVIARRFANSGFDAVRAAAIEVALEKDLVRPIGAMVKTLSVQADAGPTAVLSDTYFSEPDLTEMLRLCGVSGDRTEIVASSRAGHTKRSGALFAALRERHPAGGRLIHLGDNLFSDVWRVTRAGSIAIPFVSGGPNRYEKLLAGGAIEPAILRSAIAGSARTARLRTAAATSHEQEIAKISSDVSGVMLFAFVAWVIARAQALQLQRLYFLARDGEILIEIARRIIARRGLPIEVRYLYVSRGSLHLPAIGTICDEDFKSLAFNVGQTLGDLLRKLELPANGEILSKLEAVGFTAPPLDVALSQTQLDALKAALRHEDITPLIAARAVEQRALLLDYLRQEKLLDPGAIGIVDIGWKGRLQRSLAAVLRTKDDAIESRLTGFYYGLYDWPPASGRLESYLDEPEASALAPYVRGSLFEVFCAAQHGTTRGYSRQPDGRVAPVLAFAINEEANAWGLPVQQEAILHFADDLLAVISKTGMDILDYVPALTKAAAIVTSAFIGGPSYAEARALGCFPHMSDQLHTTYAEVAPPLPLNPAEWLRRFRARRHQRMISYWPEGSVVRALPGPVAYLVLRALRALQERRDRRLSEKQNRK
jgi:predicted HAD superfamily hydrolase